MAEQLPLRMNVAIIVTDGRGRVLVGERGDRPGQWQLPQGGVDDGEDLETAARRELEEETGLTGLEIVAQSAGAFSYLFPAHLKDAPIARHYRGQSQYYFVMRSPDGALPGLQENDDEFRAFAWKDPEEVLAGIVAFKREVYRQAFDELRDWIYPQKSDTVSSGR